MNNPKQTASQYKADAYGDVDYAVTQGTPWETIYANITNNASGYASAGLSYQDVLNYAKAKYSATQDAYASSQTTPQALQQRAANDLTNSAFKLW